jgi:hypothetical protein
MKDSIEILFTNIREKRSIIKDIRSLRKKIKEYKDLYDKKDLFIVDYIDLNTYNANWKN